MARPNIKVLIDLSAGLEWNAATEQDVTQWVAQVSVKRGRTRLLNEFEAGNATVVLFDNGSGLPAIPTDYIQTGKIKITVEPFTTEYPVFYGFISSTESQFSQSTNDISRLTFNCVDAFRLLNTATVTTVTGAVAQLSGTRIAKILDQVSYPASLRALDPGVTTCQADPGGERTALAAIRTVEKTEAGGFFIGKEGNATFYDRDTLYNKLYIASSAVSPVAFIDQPVSSGGIGRTVQYQNAVVKADDDLVYNYITVTRVGGTTQTQQDATSISTYFQRTAQRSDMLMQTNTEASDLASALLATLKDAETRIDQVSVDITDMTSDTASYLFPLELLDVVTARKQMPDGSTLLTERICVQGMQFNFTPNRSVVTYYLAEPLIKGFILDDWVYGRLDYNGLGY